MMIGTNEISFDVLMVKSRNIEILLFGSDFERTSSWLMRILVVMTNGKEILMGQERLTAILQC